MAKELGVVSPDQCTFFDLASLTSPDLERHRRERKIDNAGVVADVACGLSSRVAKNVADFHSTFGLPMSLFPTIDVDDELASLRIHLLEEEVNELADACRRRDLIAIADGIGDVLYVTYGTALTYGIDADAIVDEVHRSNMSKTDDNGRPVIRSDGKVMKGPNYAPPDIEAVLRAQERRTTIDLTSE